MLNHPRWIAAVLMTVVASGCRTATRTIDASRVDVDLPHEGNRGYLVGAPPAWEGPKKTIRKMVEMEIETPPIWRPAQPSQQPSVSSDLTETASTSVQEMPSAVPAEERPPYTK